MHARSTKEYYKYVVPKQVIGVVFDSMLRYVNLLDTLHNATCYRLLEDDIKGLF